MAFCTRCGTQFEAGTFFCGDCGSSVAAAATLVMKSPAIQHLGWEAPAPVALAKSTFAVMCEAGKSSTKPALIRDTIRVVPIIVIATFFFLNIVSSYAQSQSAPQTRSGMEQSTRILNSLRNARLEIDKSTTFDQAVERTFPHGAWKSFIAGSKGLIIVEFDSTWTLSKFVSTIGMAGCKENSGCSSTILKIGDYCDKHPSKSCIQTQLDQNAKESIPVALMFAFDPNTEKAIGTQNNLGITDEQLINLIYNSTKSSNSQANGETRNVDSSTAQTMQTYTTTTIAATGEIVKTKMGNSPIDEEARVEALKVLEGMLTQCGDKYYIWNDIGWNHNEFIEFRDKPHFSIGSGPVSDMDRLNGLMWQGSAGMSGSSAERVLKLDEIEPWREGQGHDFQFRKSNNVWKFSQTWRKGTEKDGTTLVDGFIDKVPCEQVSDYLSRNISSGSGSQ
jgi:hypothetical protein